MGVGRCFNSLALEIKVVLPRKCGTTKMVAEHKSERLVGGMWNIAFGNCWSVAFARNGRKHRKSTSIVRIVGGVGRWFAHHNRDVSDVASIFTRSRTRPRT